MNAQPATQTKISPKRSAAELRSCIMDAAIAAFAMDGFHGATLKIIASAADTSLSLLIYHFGSKIDLWKASVDCMAARVAARYAAVDFTTSLTAGARLQQLLKFQIQLAAEMPEYHRIIVMESYRHSPRLEWLVSRQAPEAKFVRSVILAAQDEGFIPELDPERLRYMIVGVATIPSLAAEYLLSTGRDALHPEERAATERFVFQLLFGGGARYSGQLPADGSVTTYNQSQKAKE